MTYFHTADSDVFFGMVENRPDTSQVAKAINAGGGLP